MRRTPISAPAPGPNGRMKRTGCCGQAWVWASVDGADKARIAKRETTRTQSFDIFQVLMRGMMAGRQSFSFLLDAQSRREFGLLPSPLWGGGGGGGQC